MKSFTLVYLFAILLFLIYLNYSGHQTYLFKRIILVSEIQTEFNFDYKHLFTKYNLNETLFFGLPYVSVINSSIFQSFADHVSVIHEDSIKCGDIIFVKTDYIQNFFENLHSKIKTRYILITHQSDYSVGYPEQLEYLNDDKVVVWYGQNIGAKHSKLKPVPLGVYALPNDTMDTVHHFVQNVIPYYDRKILLYINFSSKTNANRSAILDYFNEEFGNSSNILFEKDRLTWTDYLKKLTQTRFVISPPGNGIDCFRTWESIAMGAVPIVLKTHLKSLYENMPVMVVNDWKEVTEESMMRFERESLTSFSKDGIPWRPKLWLRYWINEIMNLKKQVSLQKCP